MRYSFFLLFMLISSSIIAGENSADPDNQEVIERIKPVGEVTINEASEKNPNQTAKQTPAAQPSSGEKTYQQYCVVCHKEGVAGAPKMGDLAAWEPRFKSAKGIGGLVEVALKGKNAMPPKGTCATCTPDDIKAAIIYMLPDKLKNSR